MAAVRGAARIAGAVVAALLALVLVVAIVGWTLPVRHRATRQATFRAPPDQLFAVITNTADFPSWRSKVTRAETLPDENGRHRFREVGGDGSILYEVEESVPGQRLVTRIADPSLPFGGRWTYELAPAAGGTALRITEDGEVYNPIFRVVSRFVLGHTATIDTYLHDLAKRLGEEAPPRA